MAKAERTIVKEIFHPTKKDPKKPGKKLVIGIRYSDDTVLIKYCRASYPHVGKAYAGKDGKDRPGFSIVGLMPKDSHKGVKDLLVEMKNEILTEKKVKALASEKFFLRDGDKSDKEANEGNWTVSARETKRPSVRDAKGRRITDADAAEALIFGGCWVNILIRPWWQNNVDYGKRVNANLIAVQHVRDDEAFGEGRIGEDDIDETFDSEEEEDGDEDGFDADDDGDDSDFDDL